MADEVVYRLMLVGLFVTFVGYRGYCTRKWQRSNSDTVTQRERGLASRAADLLALPGLLAVALYAANPAWMAWAAWPLPDWLRWLGVPVAAGGFALLHWAHQALERNWSDTPRLLRDQALVTDGPYRWIRHPLYAGFLLIMSATLLISANWLIGLLWIGLTALETASRVEFEEALMLETFGGRYRAYQQRTGRLFPRFGP